MKSEIYGVPQPTAAKIQRFTDSAKQAVSLRMFFNIYKGVTKGDLMINIALECESMNWTEESVNFVGHRPVDQYGYYSPP